MKKALIDSTTSRVIQIEEKEFEVHGALYWVDCPDDAGTFYLYDPENLTFEDPHAHTKDEFGNPVEPFGMQRMRAYPPLGDQLDLLYKEIAETGTISTDGTWFKSITAVKESVPKPIDPSVNIQHIDSDGTIVSFYENVPGTRTSGKGKEALFKFRKSSTELQVVVTNGGVGYAIEDVITIPKSNIEASADVKLSVVEADENGSIISVVIKQ